jgi:hypothetical protein
VIDNIDAALDTVNNTRATFGATQSRFEAIIANLQVAVENQSAARSRIMDADFAAKRPTAASLSRRRRSCSRPATRWWRRPTSCRSRCCARQCAPLKGRRRGPMPDKQTLASKPFQAEVKQILHLVTHSLYSNKEIFLRELVSNASDACDKLRFEALDKAALFEDAPNLEVRVWFDADKKTITIRDNGIGMSADEAVAHLGTIAKSGTREFMAGSKATRRRTPT